MHKGRLEAFSDGVIAIIITIMVLEFKVPHGDSLQVLIPIFPTFLTYVLSFVFIGIYWNNHHHLLFAAEHINGKVLWANLYLLFWLSLIPFVTNWMGENNFTQWPVALYGFCLIMNGIAYYILSQILLKQAGKDSKIAKVIGKDKKGIISLVIYLIGILLAFYNPKISLALYFTVAIIWFVPDTRIEKTILKPDNR